ncbi:MAG: type II toxin-antitoxin system VapC family toxin [Devosia nanyangense]|uniref:Ribonuclease VapC n=1 Tax=Devosia nanyangense TaxID=1228055 RepID=A0A933L375_9HYPH|nr:type II toxin-antitoxin system VapC family toxin [Devosia nanyangense]
MIILDTNVLSEFTKPVTDPQVFAWLDAQPRGELAVTAVTKAEMLGGAMILDDGARRRRLIELIGAALAPFEGAMLAFDSEAAAQFAALTAKRRSAGRPIGIMDAQIDAIALARGAIIATRDTDDFSGVGVELIDPWTA